MTIRPLHDRRIVAQGTSKRGFTPGAHVTWRVREPNDGEASTTLPPLPAAYAALDPAANPTTTQFYGVGVGYVDYDTVTGFCLAPPTGTYRSHSTSGWTYNTIFPS